MPVNVVNSTTQVPQNRSKKVIKTVAATGAVAAAAVTSALYLAKTGKLAPNESGNKVIETVKKTVNTYAQPALKKVETVKSKIVNSELIKKIPYADKISSFAKKVKNSVKTNFLGASLNFQLIKNKGKELFQTVKNNILKLIKK